MFTSANRWSPIALLGLAVFALPQSASAQFQMAPGLGGQRPFNAAAGFNPYNNGNNGVFGRPNVAGPGGPGGFNPYLSGATMSSVASAPSGGGQAPYYPGYSPFAYYGEAGGYLMGVSSYINATGQLMTSTSQARLANQQIAREKIENRRRMFDEWLYERANTPTYQDEFERMQKLALRRYQNDPPVTEILSAQSLNDLLVDIQRHMNQGGPEIPLDDELLRKINVSPAGKGSDVNVGVLKNEGKLGWPPSLRGGNFKRERDLINQMAAEAFNQGNKGAVDIAVINQMNDAVEKMLADLAANIREIPPPQYIESKRFLTDLRASTKVLGRNDVANFFNNKYSAKGKTVNDLIKNMTKDGLKFAPAINGEESAYVALHRLLAAYDVSINGGEQRRE